MWHYFQEINPCTPEKAEMKQIIEKESNLLNKIISYFFSHRAGLAHWPGPI